MSRKLFATRERQESLLVRLTPQVLRALHLELLSSHRFGDFLRDHLLLFLKDVWVFGGNLGRLVLHHLDHGVLAAVDDQLEHIWRA